MEFMTLIQSARSVRRFKQTPITMKTLEELVAYVRYSPCGANQQKLKVLPINDAENMKHIFPVIKWAGALKDWDGPEKGQRPMAYMVLMLDKTLGQNPGVDHGIAAQSIVLGARAMNLGACMIGAFNKLKLIEVLQLPETLEPLLIIALGEQDEEIVIEDLGEDGSTTYYRDEHQVHHVPKRSLDSLIWHQS